MVRLGQELARRHPGKFRMVAVSVDDGWDPVKRVLRRAAVLRPAAGASRSRSTPIRRSTRAYYCTARGFCPDIKFPETYIVDQAGRLVAYVVGPRDWNHPAARAFLERLIGS